MTTNISKSPRLNLNSLSNMPRTPRYRLTEKQWSEAGSIKEIYFSHDQRFIYFYFENGLVGQVAVAGNSLEAIEAAAIVSLEISPLHEEEIMFKHLR